MLKRGIPDLDLYEYDESGEEREELVEKGAGSKDGGSVSSSGSVEEDMSEDFPQNVVVELEENERSGHRSERYS